MVNASDSVMVLVHNESRSTRLNWPAQVGVPVQVKVICRLPTLSEPPKEPLTWVVADPGRMRPGNEGARGKRRDVTRRNGECGPNAADFADWPGHRCVLARIGGGACATVRAGCRPEHATSVERLHNDAHYLVPFRAQSPPGRQTVGA